MPSQSTLRRWLAPLVLVLLMALAFATGLHEYLTLQSLVDNRAALRILTADHFLLVLTAYVLIYVAVVALSLPGALFLTITGSLLFGWLIGGAAAVLAATLGAIVVFQITKSSFGTALAHRAGPALAKMRDGFAADAFNYLLFLRLVPAFPFWLVNIAAALANLRLRTFALATFLGIIPGTFAFSFVGQGLDSLIDAQLAAQAACRAANAAAQCPLELSLSSLLTNELLFAFAALGIVALIPVALKKWNSRKMDGAR